MIYASQFMTKIDKVLCFFMPWKIWVSKEYPSLITESTTLPLKLTYVTLVEDSLFPFLKVYVTSLLTVTDDFISLKI